MLALRRIDEGTEQRCVLWNFCTGECQPLEDAELPDGLRDVLLAVEDGRGEPEPGGATAEAAGL